MSGFEWCGDDDDEQDESFCCPFGGMIALHCESNLGSSLKVGRLRVCMLFSVIALKQVLSDDSYLMTKKIG